MPYVTSVERLAKDEGRREGHSEKRLRELHRLAITVSGLEEFRI